MRPIDGQTLHQHRYRAGGGSPFRTPRVHPCEITCVSFHKKGEGESEREIVNKMLTTATIQSFLLVSHEAEKFPSCRFSESVLSRRGYHVALQLPFFEFLEREVERPRSSLESLSLSLSLVSFRVEYHLSRFLAFHYHLFFFLAGVVENNDAIENRGGRGFFLSLSRPPRRKFRLKHATCAHSYAILGRRFVSIPLSSFLD